MKKSAIIISIFLLANFTLGEPAGLATGTAPAGQNEILKTADEVLHGIFPEKREIIYPTDDSTGVVQFMTFFTLPACPPLLPFPIDTFDISGWIPEGNTWELQPVSLIGTPWADIQPAIDGLMGMMADIPLGFTMDYDSAKVWVELHINQNTTYTPGFPVGTHTWPNGMYFEPLAGYPGEILWINVDFYSYLYTGLDDSLEYGTDLNPFVSPLHVSFDSTNIQPFVEGLPGYDPQFGTFFNFQTSAGAISSAGIVPDLFQDWLYDVYHFTPFIGGMNNGTLTQTTISSVSVETEAGIVTAGWITQTEYDSDYFNVYRDGAVIVTVPAAGQSADPLVYEYLDEAVTPGVEYDYQVSVVMLDGAESIYPETFTVTPGSLAGVTVDISIDGEDIILNWEEVAGAVSYNVYRSAEPYFDISGLTPVAEPATSTYEDTGALSEGSYFYIVTWED